MSPETAVAESENLHAWESGGAESSEALTAWVSGRLAAHEAALAGLLAVDRPANAGELPSAL